MPSYEKSIKEAQHTDKGHLPGYMRYMPHFSDGRFSIVVVDDLFN
jgi:hypothetical protein